MAHNCFTTGQVAGTRCQTIEEERMLGRRTIQYSGQIGSTESRPHYPGERVVFITTKSNSAPSPLSPSLSLPTSPSSLFTFVLFACPHPPFRQLQAVGRKGRSRGQGGAPNKGAVCGLPVNLNLPLTSSPSPLTLVLTRQGPVSIARRKSRGQIGAPIVDLQHLC